MTKDEVNNEIMKHISKLKPTEIKWLIDETVSYKMLSLQAITFKAIMIGKLTARRQP